MKYISKLFLSLCLLMGLGAIAAQAQVDSGVTIEANVPFAFTVNDTTLPAGKYSVKVVDGDTLNVMEIRSAAGRTAVLFDTETAQADGAPRKSELVFNKIGDNYFLSQVFLGGDDTGNQLLKSRMEKRLEAGVIKSEKHSIAAIKRQSKRSNQSARKGS